MRWFALAVLMAMTCAGENLRGGGDDLADLMESALEPEEEASGDAQGDEQEEEAFEVSAGDVKDATAHAVDQTLVGKAEEDLAEKESEDPLLSDPLLSLENEHEGEEGLDSELEALDSSMEEEEEKLFYDPKLFSQDTVGEMDLNDDGFLDEDELVKHMTKSIDTVRKDEFMHQKEVNAEGVKEIMGMMDDNKDGLLSKEEMFGKTTQSSRQAISDNRMFDFADGSFGNKDGELDADEVFIMALPQYSEDRKAWYKFKAEDHLENMDTDEDGLVSYKEYEQAMEEAGSNPDENVGLMDSVSPGFGGVPKDFFNAADTDSDGKLDVYELAVLVENLEKRNMKDTIDGLIQIGDDNHDGKLALAEIINHVSDFGGHMFFFLNDPDLLFSTEKHNDLHLLGKKAAQEKKEFVKRAISQKKIAATVAKHLFDDVAAKKEYMGAKLAGFHGIMSNPAMPGALLKHLGESGVPFNRDGRFTGNGN
jgi:Ca2+-binding EF-hand superfamily protein